MPLSRGLMLRAGKKAQKKFGLFNQYVVPVMIVPVDPQNDGAI